MDRDNRFALFVASLCIGWIGGLSGSNLAPALLAGLLSAASVLAVIKPAWIPQPLSAGSLLIVCAGVAVGYTIGFFVEDRFVGLLQA